MGQLTITTEAGGFVVPTCPSWCTLPADHDLDDELAFDPDGSVMRTHVAGEWTLTGYESAVIRVCVARTDLVGRRNDNPDNAGIMVHADTFLNADQGAALTQAVAEATALLRSIDGDPS